ncbi:MAG TPA: ABC transporter ATP-binding protein [Polyangia bacterium]|nr:ABC transporter ATP-binding protein [Polyangia bacterium]
MIQVEGLTKYYGAHAAIRDLTFNIERGEVIGFLGLNGAGKSTTLRVLGCVLLPTAGRVHIDGFDVVRDPHEIRKKIGFLPDTPPLYNEMTVDGYLQFVAELRGVDGPSAKKRVAEVEEKTGLREVHSDVIGSLSHGYRQRVGLAQAIVHNPDLLILDEPSSGLDPEQQKQMRELIKNLRGAHTILISSHNLPEISKTCDRLLVINEGQIVAQETEQKLAERFVTNNVVIEVAGSAEQASSALRQVSGVSGVTPDGNVLRVMAAPELRPQLVRALVQANVDVLRVDMESAQLESIFLKLTQGKN